MYPVPHASADPWLQRWLTTIRERAGASVVLELGCGDGGDTATLIGAGLHVVAVDRSADAVERARIAVPDAEFHVCDLRSPFPVHSAQVIVASLSLHYFDWAETRTIIQRIRATLGPSGLFIGRFNSTNDHNFGASGYPRIDENYYRVRGRTKRFFDRASIDALFGAGWRILGIEELTIHRYDKPKVVWEVVAERNE
jgi:SAM-dependent methyltransferase